MDDLFFLSFLSKYSKDRASDLDKKYELDEIIKGDSIFCATGITSGDLVSGIKIKNNQFISETLITHKSAGIKKIIRKIQNR